MHTVKYEKILYTWNTSETKKTIILAHEEETQQVPYILAYKSIFG